MSIVPTGSLEKLVRTDVKIFSVLKIVSQRAIVKTSRGTQNMNNKQTETNGLG